MDDGTSTDFGGVADEAPDNTDGNWHHVMVTADRDDLGKIYYDGVSIASGDISAISGSVSYATPMNIGHDSIVREFKGEMSTVRLYNRALSADEVKASYSGQAVPFSDVGADNVNLLETYGDVEGNVTTGWYVENSSSTAAITVNTTNPMGGSYDIQMVVTGDQVGYPRPYMILESALVPGKKYRLSFKSRHSSGDNITPYFRIGSSGATTQYVDVGGIITTSAQTFSAEFTANEAYTYLYLLGFNNDGGNTIWFDDVSVTKVGAVAEYLPTSIGQSRWIDTSGNDNHGTVTGATKVGDIVLGWPVGIGMEPTSYRLTVEAHAQITSPSATPLLRLEQKPVDQVINTGGEIQFAATYRGPAVSQPTETVTHARIKGLRENASAANYAGYLSFCTDPGGGSTGNEEKMRISSSGDIKAVLGNFVMGAAGKGIDFSGAGTAAEILHDYEEGTFTPTTNSDATGAFHATAAYTTGDYIKVGRMVHIQIVFWVATTFTNNLIGGLPFAPSATGTGSGWYGMTPVITASPTNSPVFAAFDSATTVEFMETTTYGAAGTASKHLPNSSPNVVYRLGFTYMAAS